MPGQRLVHAVRVQLSDFIWLLLFTGGVYVYEAYWLHRQPLLTTVVFFGLMAVYVYERLALVPYWGQLLVVAVTLFLDLFTGNGVFLFAGILALLLMVQGMRVGRRRRSGASS